MIYVADKNCAHNFIKVSMETIGRRNSLDLKEKNTIEIRPNQSSS